MTEPTQITSYLPQRPQPRPIDDTPKPSVNGEFVAAVASQLLGPLALDYGWATDGEDFDRKTILWAKDLEAAKVQVEELPALRQIISAGHTSKSRWPIVGDAIAARRELYAEPKWRALMKPISAAIKGRLEAQRLTAIGAD